MRERAKRMLISGQSDSTSAINKRIIRTSGVRVLGKAASKPQIHVVQNATVTQQQKSSDTSSSDINFDSTQVNKTPNQDINEKSNQNTENLHKENSEDLQKDNPGKETEKETDKENDGETNKEDSKVQRTAQPKKEPRRKRHHILPSEVKPVSKEPSASALNMARQPPAEKPIPVPRTAPTSASALNMARQPPTEIPIPLPRTATTPKTEIVSKEEDVDNVNSTVEADIHDEVCTTPSSGIQSPDSTQVSWI